MEPSQIETQSQTQKENLTEKKMNSTQRRKVKKYSIKN